MNKFENLREAGIYFIDILKKLPIDELRLKNGWTENIPLKDGRMIPFSIIIIEIDRNTVFVAVQGFLKMKWCPIIQNSFVDGFKKRIDGTIIEPDSKELYDYM